MKRLLILSVLILAVGCSDDALETGYRPHKLTDNADVQKTYYAPAYSPEAQARHDSGDVGMTLANPGH